MPRQKSTHVDSAEAAGRRIREIREQRGLRQRDLAFPGCTPAYISRIEAGARIPSLQLIEEFARRLGVSSGFLARGEDTSADAVVLADAQLAQRLGEIDDARAAYLRLRGSDDRDTRRAATLGLGQLELLSGDLDRGIELLEDASSTDTEDRFGDVATVEALADAYARRGDLAGAIALLERKLEAAGQDPIVRFRLSVLLANALIDLGEFGRAEATLGDAIATLGAAPDPIALARCLWSQSRLQTARGNSDLALHYAEDALSLINATEHAGYAARAQQLIAYIENERGNPAQALEVVESALPLVLRGRDKNLVAAFQVERARALVALGRVDEARVLAGEVLRELDHLSKVDAARTLAVMAEVSAAAGDNERALELFQTAADELADRETAPMLVTVYSRWSELLEESGDTEKALEVARRALRARGSGARL